MWNDIEHTFMILKDWFEDHTLYHKIGFLITSKKCTLSELYQKFQGSDQIRFKNSLDNEIRNSIDLGDRKLEDLNYNDDYQTIQNLLLLFNVESVRQNGEQTARFPL